MQHEGECNSVLKRRVSKSTGHSRDRRGCKTCRQRRKKCDSVSHVCGPCLRLNLQCIWEAERNIVPITPEPQTQTQEHRSPTMSSSVLRAPRPLDFCIDSTTNEVTTTSIRRLAMRYYVSTFAKSLSTNTENNGFLSVLLPMAMESAPLLDTMIALSSSHLALNKRDLEIKALEDRSAALTTFASSFTTGLLGHEIALAACLVFVSMETILGDTSSWYQHMLGAASVIHLTIQSKDNGRVLSSLERTVEGRWLLRNFAYHDILASVTLNQELLIPGLYWLGEGDNVVDTYFGLASIPMMLLGEISTLFAHRSHVVVELDNGEDTEPSQYDAHEKILRIEDRLLTWRPEKAPDASLVCLAESYRSAALIHLYRVVRANFPGKVDLLEAKVDHEVKRIIRHATDMPEGCLPECTLLFPLFLAGGEAQGADQQESVRRRLQDIVKHRHFENMSVALSVLEEVWDLRKRNLSPGASSRPYDWTCVLKRRGWKLALS